MILYHVDIYITWRLLYHLVLYHLIQNILQYHIIHKIVLYNTLLFIYYTIKWYNKYHLYKTISFLLIIYHLRRPHILWYNIISYDTILYDTIAFYYTRCKKKIFYHLILYHVSYDTVMILFHIVLNNFVFHDMIWYCVKPCHDIWYFDIRDH